MRCSDGRIYTFETRDEAEKAAKLCYTSSKIYEIVKIEGDQDGKGKKYQAGILSK